MKRIYTLIFCRISTVMKNNKSDIIIIKINKNIDYLQKSTIIINTIIYILIF